MKRIIKLNKTVRHTFYFYNYSSYTLTPFTPYKKYDHDNITVYYNSIYITRHAKSSEISLPRILFARNVPLIYR